MIHGVCIYIYIYIYIWSWPPETVDFHRFFSDFDGVCSSPPNLEEPLQQEQDRPPPSQPSDGDTAEAPSSDKASDPALLPSDITITTLPSTPQAQLEPITLPIPAAATAPASSPEPTSIPAEPLLVAAPRRAPEAARVRRSQHRKLKKTPSRLHSETCLL